MPSSTHHQCAGCVLTAFSLHSSKPFVMHDQLAGIHSLGSRSHCLFLNRFQTPVYGGSPGPWPNESLTFRKHKIKPARMVGVLTDVEEVCETSWGHENTRQFFVIHDLDATSRKIYFYISYNYMCLCVFPLIHRFLLPLVSHMINYLATLYYRASVHWENKFQSLQGCCKRNEGY